MGLGAAVVAAAVVGGVASNRAASKAAKAQNRASMTAAQATRSAAGDARADVNRLFPSAQLSAKQGFGGALNVFKGALPEQADIFQQGNVAGQQAILAGLPQIQNAILGGNVDLSGLQAFQPDLPNFDFTNQALAGFGEGQLADGPLRAGGDVNFLRGQQFSLVPGGGSGIGSGNFGSGIASSFGSGGFGSIGSGSFRGGGNPRGAGQFTANLPQSGNFGIT